MVENIQVKNKKDKIDKIKLSLIDAERGKKEVKFSRFFGVFCINLGVSSQKMKEYLESLENAELIKINEEKNTIQWIGNI